MNVPALRRRHLLAYIVATCALAVACLDVVPGASLAGATAQTALAGASIVAMLALFDPGALRGERRAPEDVCGTRAAIALVLAIALAAGLATTVLAASSKEVSVPPAPPTALPPLADIALFLVLCLITGVFEEALFRGVLFRGFAEWLEGAGTRRPLLIAAAASATVFGVLHVSGTAVPSPDDAVSFAQFIGKPVQAAFFGFIMAGVYARSGNLWQIVGVHAAFNVLSELPSFAADGLLVETYVTGNPADLAVLLGTVALFAPLVAVAARWLAFASASVSRETLARSS